MNYWLILTFFITTRVMACDVFVTHNLVKFSSPKVIIQLNSLGMNVVDINEYEDYYYSNRDYFILEIQKVRDDFVTGLTSFSVALKASVKTDQVRRIEKQLFERWTPFTSLVSKNRYVNRFIKRKMRSCEHLNGLIQGAF